MKYSTFLFGVFVFSVLYMVLSLSLVTVFLV